MMIVMGGCGNKRDVLIAGRPGSSGVAAVGRGVGPMSGAVLYIDDNQDNILLVQRLVRRSHPDAELRTAYTGRAGVEAAIASPPALILLDNRLPDTNGEQVLGQLAASPATAAIPVVILSGDTGQTTVNELLAAGAVDFLGKPFDIQQLAAIIDRYLR